MVLVLPLQLFYIDTIMKEKDVPTRVKWMPPVDFVALTLDEYLEQQRYIRDMANETVCGIMERGGKMKGVLALQRIGLDAAAEVSRIEKELGTIIKGGKVDGITVGYEMSLPVPVKAAPEA